MFRTTDDHRRLRSGAGARHRRRATPPGRARRAHRLRELRQSAGARGAGLGAHQQVRRRLSRQALLRRLRVRRRGRDSWPSSAPSNSSAPTTPTCSRTPARRRTRPAYFALVQPGDTILGMSLDHGGHLTHGAQVNFSGKFFRAVQYGIRPDTGEIDYDQVQRLAEEHRPKMIIAGFSAYSRIVDWARFARDRQERRRLLRRRHGARRRAGGGRHLPEPAAARRRRDHHHAQDAARPARRTDPGARQRGDRQEAQLAGLPRHPGRTAHARDRRQGGGAARGAAAANSATTSARCSPTRAPWRRGWRAAATRSSPAAPTTTCSS